MRRIPAGRAAPLTLTALVALGLLAAAPAAAQQSNEDRLREALRRSTADARALQDSQAALQAQLAEVTKDRDALKVLLDQARAQSAPAPAAPAADPAELAALRAELGKAHGDSLALQAALAKWQAAYQQAAGLAQTKAAEAQRAGRLLGTAQQDLATCQQANTSVIKTARDILHLYQTKGFRTLVLESYEPLLGLKRVELDNTVQGYEDRLADGTYYPPAKP